MSITTGTLFRKTIDTIADGSTYRKPTIDEISKLKADGNFFGDIYESTGTDKIIDAISSYIMSVSTGDTLFDLNPSGSGDASLENILLFGEGGRIFLADQTLDFINASGTEIIGRGIRVWESDSKYAKLAFENDAAVLEVVGGTITGGAVQTSSGIEQRVVIDGSDNTLKFYNSSNDLKVLIDDNIWSSNPGIELINGVYVTRNSGWTESTIIYEGQLLQTTESQGIPVLFSNSFPTTFDYGTGISKTVRIWADDYGQFNNANGERTALECRSVIYYATTSIDAIGIHTYTENAGSGESIGVRVRTDGTAQDVHLRLQYETAPFTYADVDLKVDSNGYLNVVPAGDKLVLWESGGVANDSTQMWTDTDGIFNLKPDGDKLRIWESVGGAGHYGDIYANTAGNLVINGGTGNVVYVDDNFNVSGTYSRAGTIIVDASRNCDFNNINADGAFQMDGSDIISTSAQQTGSFITRTYVSFGRDANLTRTNPGSTTADAATVDGSLNLQGYRMIRAGVVTGISGQFITSARTSDDTITFTVQKNGVNQSMVATKTITGIGGTGCISTANSFSVVAEDTVNVEMTLTAGDVGTVTIANIAIAVEMLI